MPCTSFYTVRPYFADDFSLSNVSVYSVYQLSTSVCARKSHHDYLENEMLSIHHWEESWNQTFKNGHVPAGDPVCKKMQPRWMAVSAKTSTHEV